MHEEAPGLKGADEICWEIVNALGSALSITWRQGRQISVEATFLYLTDAASNPDSYSDTECQVNSSKIAPIIQPASDQLVCKIILLALSMGPRLCRDMLQFLKSKAFLVLLLCSQ